MSKIWLVVAPDGVDPAAVAPPGSGVTLVELPGPAAVREVLRAATGRPSGDVAAAAAGACALRCEQYGR